MDWLLIHLITSKGATPWEKPAANPCIHLCFTQMPHIWAGLWCPVSINLAAKAY